MKKRVLMSVFNKEGLVPFAKRMHRLGFEIVATGGTAKAVKDAGLPCTLVEEVTGFPEMMDGRLKMLHPNIFGGLLADQHDESHLAQLTAHHIDTFGMVIINFYDFNDHPSIARIDVGGPAALRAAAKNNQSVIVVVDPANYEAIALELEEKGDIGPLVRQRLAAKLFRETSEYDRMIAEHFEECLNEGQLVAKGGH